MLSACFVARVAAKENVHGGAKGCNGKSDSSKDIKLYCRWQPPDMPGAAPTLPEKQLPSAANLAPFCFPLTAEAVQQREHMAPEEYSFTLTGGDGSRLYGYCRQFLPPGCSSPSSNRNGAGGGGAGGGGGGGRYPQVLCIISKYTWLPLFSKVLEVVEQLLSTHDCVLVDYDQGEMLPVTHPASEFLSDLHMQCPQPPVLGHIMRIYLPTGLTQPLCVSPCRHIGAFAEERDVYLESTEEYVELEIPPDCGNGAWNAGIPLAPLLWHVPPHALASLLAALLLERRVVLTSQEGDKLTTVAHAAAALLHPFRWQHIYLPLLPAGLLDYLASPIPFLVGLPARFLPLLKNMPMDEVVIVDLDLGRCEPAPGSADDDGMLLPWRKRLVDGFKMVRQQLQHPSELEANPMIAALMQQYFLKLLGSYREAVSYDSPTGSEGPNDGASRDAEADIIRRDGFRFDLRSFADRQRSERHRSFLRLLRHSQLFDQWAQERLALAAEGYDTEDDFECKVAQLGPGGRHVSQPVRALSRKLPKQVTAAATRSVSAVNRAMAKSSSLKEAAVARSRPFKEAMREQLRQANIKGRAAQTFKALEGRVQRINSRLPPSLSMGSNSDAIDDQHFQHQREGAAAASGIPSRPVHKRTSPHGSGMGMGADGDPGHGIAARAGMVAATTTSVSLPGSTPASPPPLILLDGDDFFDEEDEAAAGAAGGGSGNNASLYHQLLERRLPQRAAASASAAASPLALPGAGAAGLPSPPGAGGGAWSPPRSFTAAGGVAGTARTPGATSSLSAMLQADQVTGGAGGGQYAPRTAAGGVSSMPGAADHLPSLPGAGPGGGQAAAGGAAGAGQGRALSGSSSLIDDLLMGRAAQLGQHQQQYGSFGSSGGDGFGFGGLSSSGGRGDGADLCSAGGFEGFSGWGAPLEEGGVGGVGGVVRSGDSLQQAAVVHDLLDSRWLTGQDSPSARSTRSSAGAGAGAGRSRGGTPSAAAAQPGASGRSSNPFATDGGTGELDGTPGGYAAPLGAAVCAMSLSDSGAACSGAPAVSIHGQDTAWRGAEAAIHGAVPPTMESIRALQAVEDPWATTTSAAGGGAAAGSRSSSAVAMVNGSGSGLGGSTGFGNGGSGDGGSAGFGNGGSAGFGNGGDRAGFGNGGSAGFGNDIGSGNIDSGGMGNVDGVVDLLGDNHTPDAAAGSRRHAPISLLDM